MWQGEVYEELHICTLDDIEANLGNTFLNVYHVHVLKGGSKLRVIVSLTNRFVGLKVEYQVCLTKVGRHAKITGDFIFNSYVCGWI
jgi:hypothetical protein